MRGTDVSRNGWSVAAHVFYVTVQFAAGRVAGAQEPSADPGVRQKMMKPRRSKTLACCFAIATMATPPVHAQAPQPEAKLLHPASSSVPAFEVATIKPNNTALSGPRFQLSPTGFKALHASLEQLIQFAYGMKSDDQIVDAPKWLSTEFFDIEAKDPEADVQAAKLIPMTEQMNNLRLRVQSLLAERFHLSARFGTRDVPVYALTVAKGGIRMKQVVPDLLPRRERRRSRERIFRNCAQPVPIRLRRQHGP
jgi:hypothetical protein